MMWYIILFLAGLSAGIIFISVFAAATIEQLRWENKHLKSRLGEREGSVPADAVEADIYDEKRRKKEEQLAAA